MRTGTLKTGLWGVLATPFYGPGLEVDFKSLARLVALHRSAGSSGLVVLGVFGEAAQLTPEERAAVVRAVRDQAPDLPLVIGIAQQETSEIIQAALRLLTEAPAPETVLMVQATTEDPAELTARLRSIHEATGRRIIVQDYPVVTGVTIPTSQLVEAVNACPFVAAVKSESPPTPLAISQLAEETDAAIFGGLGGLGLLDELMAGAAGAMTGFSHPEALVATVNAWFAHGYPEARRVYLPWLPLVNFEAQAGIGLALRKESLRQRGTFRSSATRPPAPGMPDRLAPLLREHLRASELDRASA